MAASSDDDDLFPSVEVETTSIAREDLSSEKAESGSTFDEEEEEEDRNIYFCVERDYLCYWYVIKNDTKPAECLDPVFSDLQPNMEYCMKFGCAASGSVIYIIGGALFLKPDNWRESPFKPDITNEVYCIDTLRPESGWTRVSPLLKPRCSAHVVTIEGKIYVMGGISLPTFPHLSDGTFENFAEFYDPSEASRGWQRALSDVPVDVRRSSVVAHEVTLSESGATQLLVHANANGDLQTLYLYNFDDESWRLYADDFGPFYCDSAIIIDDIMYCYQCLPPWNTHLPQWNQERRKDYSASGSILCFDVDNPCFKPKKLRGLEKGLLPKHNDYGHFPHAWLLHLGGEKLCLVWDEMYAYEQTVSEEYPLIVCCLKFTVSKVPKPSGEDFDLVARLVSKSRNYVNGERFLNCLAMPAFRGKTRRKEDHER